MTANRKRMSLVQAFGGSPPNRGAIDIANDFPFDYSRDNVQKVSAAMAVHGVSHRAYRPSDLSALFSMGGRARSSAPAMVVPSLAGPSVSGGSSYRVAAPDFSPRSSRPYRSGPVVRVGGPSILSAIFGFGDPLKGAGLYSHAPSPIMSFAAPAPRFAA